MLYLALLATACALPLSESFKNIFFVAALILLTVHALTAKQAPFGPPVFAWAVLGFFLSTLISAVHAPHRGLAFRGVWDVAMSTGMFFCTVAACTSKQRILILLYAIQLSIGVGDLVGLYAYVTTEPQLRILSLGDPRATAQYLAMILALQLGLHTAVTVGPAMRPIVLGTMPLTLVALVFTYARTQWITVLSVPFLFAWAQRRWRALLVSMFVALVLLGSAVWGSHSIQQRVVSLLQNPMEDGGFGSRYRDIWPVALRMIQDHPVLGVGPEGFAVEYPRQYRLLYPTPALPLVTHAHSLWLQIGAETGLLGLGFFLALLGSLAYVLLRMQHGLSDPLTTVLWYSVLGCLAMLVAGGVTSFLWGAETSMIFMLLVGLFCASERIDRIGGSGAHQATVTYPRGGS